MTTESLGNENLTHLWTQRYLTNTAEIVYHRFDGRHRFSQLITTIGDRADSILLGDDMRPASMLADPMTLWTTALIDVEFTNAMPHWWLLSSGSEAWLDRGAKVDFLIYYEPRRTCYLKQ